MCGRSLNAASALLWLLCRWLAGYFGMATLRAVTIPSRRQPIHSAPELLKKAAAVPTPAADIYALAIVVRALEREKCAAWLGAECLCRSLPSLCALSLAVRLRSFSCGRC